MPDVASQVLEIAIAIAFVFFTLSLVVSGMTELIASALRLRSRTLEHGLRQLLADEDKANALLENPLVSQMAKGERKPPSYLSSRNFALAFIDTIAPPPKGSIPGSRNVLAAVRDSAAALPGALGKQVYALAEEAGDSLKDFRTSVETWFDDAMQRVSGWYKRRAQLIVYCLAALVAIALNVDSIRITERLWDDSALRESVVGAAVETVQPTGKAATSTAEEAAVGECDLPGESETEPPATDAGSLDAVDEAAADTQACLDQLDALQLPIGWGAANDEIWKDPIELSSLATLAGWAITFFAIALGAPFWFDALSRLARLRNTGPRPTSTSNSQTGA